MGMCVKLICNFLLCEIEKSIVCYGVNKTYWNILDSLYTGKKIRSNVRLHYLLTLQCDSFAMHKVELNACFMTLIAS